MAGGDRKTHLAVRQLIVRDLFAGSKHAPKPPDTHERIKFQPPPKVYKPPVHFTKVPCPCCAREMGKPDLEAIIDWYDIPPQEEAILRTVWKGRGMPVPNERIIAAIYADDPEGGPAPVAAYTALKVAMSHLRKRLELSGVKIENAGYRQGYRLVIEEEK